MEDCSAAFGAGARSDGAACEVQPVFVASVNDDDGDEVAGQPGKRASTCQTTLEPASGRVTEVAPLVVAASWRAPPSMASQSR